MSTLWFCLALLAQLGEGRPLTLADALAIAAERQPNLRRAQAELAAAEARRDAAYAPLWPQLSASASVQRAGGGSSFAGQVVRPTSDAFNVFRFGLSASLLIWDFGNSWDRAAASKVFVEAGEQDQRTVRLETALLVRTAYFDARAARALVGVAEQTLENQRRHLDQVRGFVGAGIRPEIDLAQVRTDVANAEVQRINTANNYRTAKALLMQAMGLEGIADFEVADEALGPVEGEGTDAERLLDLALSQRPELATLEAQIRAQSLIADAIGGNYWPRLSASTAIYESGTALDALGFSGRSARFWPGPCSRAEPPKPR